MLSQLFKAACVLLVAFLTRFFVDLCRRRNRLNGLPMPPRSFIFGNLKIMGELLASLPPKMHPHCYMHYIRDKYNLPDVFYVDTWPIGYQMCAILDPEVAHQVTVQRSLPKHSSIDRSIGAITGKDSLVSVNGPAHRRWRSVFNPGFSNAHLMTLVPSIVEDCELFVENLGKHADAQDIFQLEEAATKVTIDVIGKVVLDVSMNAQTTENDFVTAFRNSLSWLAGDQEVNPFKILKPLRPIKLHLNERTMNRYLMDIMNKRFADRPEKPGLNRRSKPVIDLALDEYIKEHGSTAQTGKLNQTFQREALNHIRVFMFGGHDTTSSTICWAAYALSRNPACLRAFRAECDEVLGPYEDNTATAAAIKTDPRILSRLPYTTAIIKEALRLWPAASSVRAGLPDFSLTYNGQSFPTAGLLTWPVAPAIQRSPKFWPRANDFLPERWLAKEGEELFPVKGAWRAFEYGPRNCIGQELAMIETKIVMLLMLRNFVIETAYDEWDKRMGRSMDRVKKTPEGDRAYQVLIATAKPCDGMPVRIHRK